VTVDEATTVNVPPVKCRFSRSTRLFTDREPEADVNMISGLAAISTVTSSALVGTAPPDQFPGVCQRLSPAAPVHEIAVRSWRASSVSSPNGDDSSPWPGHELPRRRLRPARDTNSEARPRRKVRGFRNILTLLEMTYVRRKRPDLSIRSHGARITHES